MGNCLRHSSEMHWAGEDWGEFITQDPPHHHRNTKTVMVKQEGKSSVHHEIIKIRLTKKQLHDLLSQVNVQDLSFHQQPQPQPQPPSLINRQYEETNQKGLWRPVLQSIPEF